MEPFSEVAITPEPINPFALRDSLPQLDASGGYVCFEGLVRNTNHGKSVDYLQYEAYRPLAESEMKKIADEALAKFGCLFVRAVHRVGDLAIGDVAVLIQVRGGHRDESFKACRYVIDEIKGRVPIWKKETYLDGTTDWTRCQHGHGETDAAEAPHG